MVVVMMVLALVLSLMVTNIVQINLNYKSGQQ